MYNYVLYNACMHAIVCTFIHIATYKYKRKHTNSHHARLFTLAHTDIEYMTLYCAWQTHVCT